MSATVLARSHPESQATDPTRIEALEQDEQYVQDDHRPFGPVDRDFDPSSEVDQGSFTSSSEGPGFDAGIFHESKKPRPCMEFISGLPRARVFSRHRRAAAAALQSRQQVGRERDCCSVCFGDLMGSDDTFGMLIRLPCGHKYHYLCCLRWIQDNPTCPECRYELPLEDPQLEAKRAERMKGRSTMSCSCHPGLHDCFFLQNKMVEPAK
jgi:hypothetical protein